MKIKNLFWGLVLILFLLDLGLVSCSKKKSGYRVKVSVTDFATARVYRDTLKTGGITSTRGTGSIKDSLISAIDSNKNGAKITRIKVTYINDKGKKVEDEVGGLEVDKAFEKTYQVEVGKTIIVTALAEGTPVGDTLKAKTVGGVGPPPTMDQEGTTKAQRYQAFAAGTTAEVTLPTLTISIEKDGDIVVAQSTTANKGNLKVEEITQAGKKTTVSATASTIAFKAK